MKTVRHGTIKFSAELLADVENARVAEKWTPEVDKFIEEFYGTMGIEDMLDIMNKHFKGGFTYRPVHERNKKIRKRVA